MLSNYINQTAKAKDEMGSENSLTNMKRFVLRFSIVGFFVPLFIEGLYSVFGSLEHSDPRLLYGFTSIFWPLSIGMMALESSPSIGHVVLSFIIMCLINSLYYTVLGIIIWGVKHKSRVRLIAFLGLGIFLYLEYKIFRIYYVGH